MTSLWLNNSELKYLYLLLLEDYYDDPPSTFTGDKLWKFYDMRDKLENKMNELMKNNKIDIPTDGQWDLILERNIKRND